MNHRTDKKVPAATPVKVTTVVNRRKTGAGSTASRSTRPMVEAAKILSDGLVKDYHWEEDD